MNKWTLSALKGVDENGCATLTDLSKEQLRRVKSYQRALQTACGSNYAVRAAIGPVNGKFIRCGKLAYGNREADHAEQCAVHAYLSRTNGLGHGQQRPILALVDGEPGKAAGPCGNCRDILRAVFSPELEIVSGAPGGGTAIVATLGQYLFDAFLPCTNATDRVKEILKLLAGNLAIEHDSYSSQASLERMPHYRAGMTITIQHVGFSKDQKFKTGSVGAIDLSYDGHPLYPIRDAIRGAERPQYHIVDLWHVVVSVRGPGGVPDIPYRDRHDLLEFQLRLEAAGDFKSDPQVLLCRTTETGEIIQAWKTTVKQWYPFPSARKTSGKTS